MNTGLLGMRVEALVILLLLMSVPGYAVEKFYLKPSIAGAIRSDTDFFRTETDEQDIITYNILPRAEFGYKTDRSRIFADYTLIVNYHEDRSLIRKHEADNDFGHNGIFGIETNPTDRISLKAEDSYVVDHDPTYLEKFNTSLPWDKFAINRLTCSARYEAGPRLSFELSFRNTGAGFTANNLLNSGENRYIADVVWQLSPTASSTLRYQHWKNSFDKPVFSDFESDLTELIFRKEFRSVSVSVGGGYHVRSFADNASDMNIFSYRTEIEARTPSDRELPPSSFVSLSAERRFNDYAGGRDQYFTAQGIILKAGRMFSKKISLNIVYLYALNDYENFFGISRSGNIELRKDTQSMVSVSLFYAITESLKAEVFGGKDRRDSDIVGMGYDNRFLRFYLTYVYDLGARQR